MHILKFLDIQWRSMGIVRKFAAALGSMFALILFVAIVGFVALNLLEHKAASIVADSMQVQRMALEVDSRLQLARQAERDFSLRLHDLGVDGSRVVYANEFAERIGEADHNVAWLEDVRHMDQANDHAASVDRLVELRNSLERYSEKFRELVEIASTLEPDDHDFIHKSGELDSEYLHLTSLVRQLAISASDAARDARAGIAESSILVKYLLVFSVLFALLLAASIIWVMNRTVAKSIVRLSDAATELSLGNLEARADVRGKDEFAQLAGSMNVMADHITRLVDELESQAAIASDRLFEAIDSISEGFLLYDKNERLILANRRVLDGAGATTSALRAGTSLRDILRLNAESGQFVHAVDREDAWVEERLEIHREDGRYQEELLSDGRSLLFKTFRTHRGEFVVIVSDITERKRTVQNLSTLNSDLEELVRERTKVLVEKGMELKQANARLRELDELKSAFLSSVSHELRTPLTSLLGFSKLIKRDFSRNFQPLASNEKLCQLGSRIEHNLDIIGSEGERLTRLIDDVLDLSRIESGCEDFLQLEIDLSNSINKAVDAVSGLFAAKPGVRLVIRRFEVVPSVMGDPDRVHQVLINLLSNAAKFTETGEVAVDLYVDDLEMVHIAVADTGIGIPRGCLEKVFDKFHQAQIGDTLTEKPSGTGLGLAICRQIVEQHRGRIWAESRRGKGTCIHVTLPVIAPIDAPSVLVVDDDPVAQEYLTAQLHKSGYNVQIAGSGEQALLMMYRERPDLVTMDLLMPGIGGREAIRRIRQERSFDDIPILVVSVLNAHANITAGGDAALIKPVNSTVFRSTVDALLGHADSSTHVLALSKDSERHLPALCGESVTRCSEEEIWGLLGNGFEGTVAVTSDMLGCVDLDRLCSVAGVQVLLLPPSSLS